MRATAWTPRTPTPPSSRCPADHEAIAEAKELCGLCPVRRDCLDYALENVLKEGIWGGLTEAERRPWHDGLPHRLDYSRVIAFFNGRDVHLTESERQVVIDHAYVRGWRTNRLAAALQISHKHARDLLRQAAHKVFDRDRTLGVPRRKKKRQQTAPTTSRPSAQQSRHEAAGFPSGDVDLGARPSRKGRMTRPVLSLGVAPGLSLLLVIGVPVAALALALTGWALRRRARASAETLRQPGSQGRCPRRGRLHRLLRRHVLAVRRRLPRHGRHRRARRMFAAAELGLLAIRN